MRQWQRGDLKDTPVERPSACSRRPLRPVERGPSSQHHQNQNWKPPQLCRPGLASHPGMLGQSMADLSLPSPRSSIHPPTHPSSPIHPSIQPAIHASSIGRRSSSIHAHPIHPARPSTHPSTRAHPPDHGGGGPPGHPASLGPDIPSSTRWRRRRRCDGAPTLAAAASGISRATSFRAVPTTRRQPVPAAPAPAPAKGRIARSSTSMTARQVHVHPRCVGEGTRCTPPHLVPPNPATSVWSPACPPHRVVHRCPNTLTQSLRPCPRCLVTRPIAGPWRDPV